MKIALGVRHFQMSGGQEQFAVHLAQHLVQNGHEVTVYTFDGSPIPGVDLYRIPLPWFRPRARRDWVTGKCLAEYLAQSEADVTYGEQKTWNANVIRPGGGVEVAYWHYATQRKWKHGHRWIARACPKRHYDLRAERLALLAPTTKAIIVNSRLVADTMSRIYPQITEKIAVVHNGAMIPPRDPARTLSLSADMRCMLGIPPHAPAALFIGHDFYRKGLDAAIQVIATLQAPPLRQPWHLIVAGRGHRRHYLKYARKRGMDTSIHFASCALTCDCLYAAADVLLLPSHYDPFANVTVEALSAGIPVLTTRWNGGSEVIESGRNGWVVNSPMAIEDMVACLAGIGNSPEALHGFKQRALLSARAHQMKDRLQEVEDILTRTAESLLPSRAEQAKRQFRPAEPLTD